MNRIENPPHRADRIPQTQEIRCAGDTERCSETFGNREFTRIVALEKSQRVRNQSHVTRSEQPAHMQQSAECPGGISAATKAEHEDSVASFERCHQKRINICDVVGKAIAKRQAPSLCPPLSYRGEGVSRSHRTDARVVVGGLLVSCRQGPIELYDIRICRPVLIPSSVAANNDVLRHIRSTSRTCGAESHLREPGARTRTESKVLGGRDCSRNVQILDVSCLYPSWGSIAIVDNTEY